MPMFLGRPKIELLHRLCARPCQNCIVY
ncbi:hypothetical protein F383_14825 [Gossypium arboreum]|uniref:Uncharacterized protein n=1 Tax=Gossypium arboreum TaxID=29729 RepID=A0A0B0MZV1_GOSAR|nr:hypothetical protein F383_14825 [Gossypium arboreum]